MIRQLARCPYCGECEVALDDQVNLVLDPDGKRGPCPHLAWVDGRYAQWGRGEHGIDHMIGSTEFRWDPPEPDAAERTDALLSYLKELLESGPGWAYAPAQPFEARTLNAEQSKTDARGRTHLLWDVDGWAVFAADPASFWAALPACQERQLADLRVDGVGGR